MNRTFLAALAALVLAASCTPRPGARVVMAVPDRPKTAQELLKGLDLAVPIDFGKVPLAPGKPVAAGPTVAAPPFLAAAQSAEDAARAIDCLTAAVYYEARSESDDGQRAVAQVVLNRVRDRAFPRSVCGVVYQGSERRTGCQFSFTCDGSMLRPLQPAFWARARAIATAALAGEVYAPVGTATFYHANYVLPWWAASMAKITQIGAHIFYRWAGPMERALALRQTYAGVEPLPAPGGGAEAMAGQALASVLENGVTVHRGGEGAAPAEATAPSAPPAPGTIKAAMRFTQGVRIHSGLMPATFESEDDETTATPDAAGGDTHGVTIHRGGSPTTS